VRHSAAICGQDSTADDSLYRSGGGKQCISQSAIGNPLIKSSSVGSAQNVSVTALTIDPRVTSSTTSLNFGPQKVGSNSAAKSITLTNPGATSLTIDSIAITGTDPHDFIEANKCGSSSRAGKLHSQRHIYPAARAGRSAKLAIKDNAQSSSQSVILAGTGD
jgi:hypothetical protein